MWLTSKVKGIKAICVRIKPAVQWKTSYLIGSMYIIEARSDIHKAAAVREMGMSGVQITCYGDFPNTLL